MAEASLQIGQVAANGGDFTDVMYCTKASGSTALLK
jgi:hypothetical protein